MYDGARESRGKIMRALCHTRLENFDLAHNPKRVGGTSSRLIKEIIYVLGSHW